MYGQINERLACDSNITRTSTVSPSAAPGLVGYPDNLNYRFVHSVLQSLQYPTEVNKTDTVLLRLICIRQ